jgi:hypothetical protein
LNQRKFAASSADTQYVDHSLFVVAVATKC